MASSSSAFGVPGVSVLQTTNDSSEEEDEAMAEAGNGEGMAASTNAVQAPAGHGFAPMMTQEDLEEDSEEEAPAQVPPTEQANNAEEENEEDEEEEDEEAPAQAPQDSSP